MFSIVEFVKYGGTAMKSRQLQASVINDLVLLSCMGLRPVLVHGSGLEINHWLGRLNIQAIFRDGLQVIDAETMEIMSTDGPAKPDLGFAGEVTPFDLTVIGPLIDNNTIPVVTFVAADDSGQSYNINADMVAKEMAAKLGAEKLVVLTDVVGILEDRDDPKSLVKEIDIKGVKKMMEEGKASGGMISKVNCCVR